MLNTKKKKQDFVMSQKMSQNALFQLKWKTVQWLMNNKKDAMLTLVKEKASLWHKYCRLFDDVRSVHSVPS